jgi:hypothetical protein
MALYGAAGSSVAWWAVWPAPLQLVVWLIITLSLAIAVTVQLARVVDRSAPTKGRRPFDRILARKIGVVIFAYAITEGIVALAIHLLQHDALIFPVAVGITGVHFFVFARVLETWQYYVTGGLDCLAALGSVVLTNQASTIGVIPSWVFYPLLGGGIALFITAALMLFESHTILSVPTQARP